MANMDIGQRIRLARRVANLTLDQLAERLGVTGATVSRWETGERDFSTAKLLDIAGALETTSDYLLGKTDDPSRKDETRREQDEPTRGWVDELAARAARLDLGQALKKLLPEGDLLSQQVAAMSRHNRDLLAMAVLQWVDSHQAERPVTPEAGGSLARRSARLGLKYLADGIRRAIERDQEGRPPAPIFTPSQRTPSSLVATRLKRAREKNGCNLHDFAGLLGIHPMSLYAYECRFFPVAPSIVQRATELTGLDLNWFYGDESHGRLNTPTRPPAPGSPQLFPEPSPPPQPAELPATALARLREMLHASEERTPTVGTMENVLALEIVRIRQHMERRDRMLAEREARMETLVQNLTEVMHRSTAMMTRMSQALEMTVSITATLQARLDAQQRNDAPAQGVEPDPDGSGSDQNARSTCPRCRRQRVL